MPQLQELPQELQRQLHQSKKKRKKKLKTSIWVVSSEMMMMVIEQEKWSKGFIALFKHHSKIDFLMNHSEKQNTFSF